MNIRPNNFDLLRLLAAVQVVYGHGFDDLDMKSPVFNIINWFSFAFPGVPIFFMISGFLITASFERNNNLKQYTINRVLRIYPAMWVAFIISVIIISSLGYLHLKNLTDFGIWTFSQLTIFQFYNPSFLREFGVGVVNGSLWTIVVELQFYILVPIMYALINRWGGWDRRVVFFSTLFIMALVVSPFCGHILDSLPNHPFINLQVTSTNQILIKLLKVSILPYLYCFIIGTLIRLHLDKMQKILVGKFKCLLSLLIYLTLYGFFRNSTSFYLFNPATMVLLALPIFSLAFNFTGLSHAILRDNDFSYGIYIYHMLIINVFIYFGLIGNWYFLLLAIILAAILSVFSWFLVEKPALTFKDNPLRKIS